MERGGRDSPVRNPHQTPAYFTVVAVLVLVLAVFWQVGGYDFINLDDGPIFSGNSHVIKGLTREGVSWAFTTFHTGYWQPLTWLSHMVGVELFGVSPGWHHRLNVLFHLLNAELLFLVLWRMTGALWRSAFVAALFAVHPLHVESVAWVTERKDVLSTLFGILSLGAYLRYVRHPGALRYLAVVVSLALGLMSKPMLVTWPCLLLLLDFWPLGRLVPADRTATCSWPICGPALAARALEKLPLFALSVASVIVTAIGQSTEGAIVSLGTVSLGKRVAAALVAYPTYLGKMVWPVSLALYSPAPIDTTAGISTVATGSALLLLVGISGLLLWQRRCRPSLSVGWLWYLGTLVPVIGLVQVGSQAMADRFTYVPLIGAFIAVAWGLPGLSRGRHWRLALGTAAIVSVAVLAGVARVQVGYWRDNWTLASRALAVREGNWQAKHMLGLALAQRGQYEQAISWYQGALRINPADASAWQNLGVALTRTARLPQAIDAYQAALRLDPALEEAWSNLCAAFKQNSQFQPAINACRKALQLNPSDAQTQQDLGVALASTGQLPQAIAAYQAAVRLEPGYVEAWNNLCAAFAQSGQLQQAIDSCREALRLNPDYAVARHNLDLALEAQWQRSQ